MSILENKRRPCMKCKFPFRLNDPASKQRLCNACKQDNQKECVKNAKRKYAHKYSSQWADSMANFLSR